MFPSRLLRTAFAFLTGFSLVACADSSVPTGTPWVHEVLAVPPLPGSADGTNGGQWIPIPPTTSIEGKNVRGVRWLSGRNPLELSVSAEVGPAGGRLAIPGADFVIVFSEGAVLTPTTVTITSKESQWVSYDMQPHGLVFTAPVYVMQALVYTKSYQTPGAFFLFGAYLPPGKETISADDTATATETTPSFIYLDPNGVPTWSVWLLSHFSRYMLASG